MLLYSPCTPSSWDHCSCCDFHFLCGHCTAATYPLPGFSFVFVRTSRSLTDEPLQVGNTVETILLYKIRLDMESRFTGTVNYKHVFIDVVLRNLVPDKHNLRGFCQQDIPAESGSINSLISSGGFLPGACFFSYGSFLSLI